MVKQTSEKSHGIRCSAANCAYNKDGKLCEAADIEVGGPRSTCSEETQCSTYIDR